MVQVTAEVEGVVSDVRFHEGDRVGPATVLLRIDPDRYRLEAERAKAAAGPGDGRAGPGAGGPRAARGARQEPAAVGRGARPARAARPPAWTRRWTWPRRPTTSRSRTSGAPRCGRRSPASSTPAPSTPASSSAPAPCSRRSSTRAGCGLRFKVSEGESLRAREGGRVGFRVAPLGPREFGARIYHVGDVADPATRQVEVLGLGQNPRRSSSPASSPRSRSQGEKKEGALVVPESAVQASERGFVTYVVDDKRRRAMRPVGLGPAHGHGVVEILSGLDGRARSSSRGLRPPRGRHAGARRSDAPTPGTAPTAAGRRNERRAQAPGRSEPRRTRSRSRPG